MSVERELARVVTLPSPSPGQFGPDHRAIQVISPQDWEDADPFILLMDDRVDGKLRGGPHPHAGFETVTFLVTGNMRSESGKGQLTPGDVEWTTAGSGIVHGPDKPIEGQMRILQLWVTLPRELRWTEPDHQLISSAQAPVRREPGIEIRVFSGSSGEVRSSTRNRVPLNVLDIRLDPGAAVDQDLPSSHNGFLYVLEGAAHVGSRRTALVPGQIGWLDRTEDRLMGSLRLSNSGDRSLRVLVYSGERQNVPIISYGPFIGDSRQDIVRSFERYQSGSFRRY